MMSATSPTAASHPTTTDASGATNYRADPNRRASFNFLRRQKSTDGAHRMLTKKSRAHQYPPQQAVPPIPPQLPTPAQFSNMNGTSFIGENAQEQYTSSRYANSTGLASPGPSYTAVSPLHQSSSPPSYGVPIPPIPASSTSYSRHADDVDPYARSESMTHRGRYSYASSAISVAGINSPRRVRRRKDPTPFNILVIGAQNSGKTSFIDFLRSSFASKNDRKREKNVSPPTSAASATSPFTPHYLETEVDQERIGVTIWDSQGLEKKFVDLQLREMSSFLESKFEDTFNEESKVVRAPGVRDTHIHCVFLILDPSRLDSNLAQSRRKTENSPTRFDEPVRLMGILDEDLDVQVLKTLQGKTTVIPVISKADTITANHMGQLKRAVWDSLKQAKLDPLEALQFGDGDGDDESDSDRFDERDEDSAVLSESFHAGDTLSDGPDFSDEELNRERDEHPSESLPNPRARPVQHKRTASGLSARLSQAVHDSTSNAPYLPMSIISPDTYEPGVVGRKFPWGFADPYNSEHCDFVRLKDSVFNEWRAELREASREIWYEGWRTSRLNRLQTTPSKPTTSGNGSMINGRARNPSGTVPAKELAVPQRTSPYAGRTVHQHASMPPPGTAYSTSPPVSNGYQSPMSPRSAHSAPGLALSSPGGPEMVKGVYVQGVNAF